MKEKIKNLAAKAKETITSFSKKAIEYIKKYPVIFGCGAVVAVVISAVIIVLNSNNGSGNMPPVSSEASPKETIQWGIGVTEGIPAFSEVADRLDLDNSGYGTAYYSGVTMEQANGYAEKLSDELGITFSQEQTFPRSAIWEEKIIVIHYNVTEMKLSVTVTEKSNGSNQ